MLTRICIICFFLAGIPQRLLGIDSWDTPPTTISTPGLNADSPKMAVNSNNQVIGIWVEDQVIVSRRSILNGDWDDMTYLSGAGSSTPQVVINGSGTSTAIWLENGFVQTSEREWEGKWSTPETLSGPNASNCNLVINATGNVVAAWLEEECVQVKTKALGEVWSPSAVIISASGAVEPDIDIGAEGTIVAVWVGSDQSIYSASASFGGSWSIPVLVSSSGILTACPSVSVNKSGQALASWFCFNENNGIFSDVIVQSAFGEMDTWVSPSDISDVNHPFVVNPRELQLTCKTYANGSAIVAWTSSYDGAYYNIEYCLFNFENWQPPRAFLSNKIPCSFGIDIDWQNYAYLVGTYLGYESPYITLYGSLINLNDSTPYLAHQWLFATEGNSCSNFVASTKSGSVDMSGMIWKNYNGSTVDIQVLLAKVPVIEPPNKLAVNVVSQDYGVFIQYNNVLTWSASPSLIVTEYSIYRNDIYLTTVSSDVLSYIDFNQGDESGNYKLVAHSSYGLISDAVSINFP